MDFSTLITDRTRGDVLRWQELRNKGFSNMTTDERAEWVAGMKGAYKMSDLNRVGECLNYLRDRLSLASYIPADSFTAKTDWSASDVPTGADLTYYLGCVSTVREGLSQFATTPPTPADTGGLNCTEANNIEKILLDVETLINNMLQARYFLNDLYCGEVN